MESPLVSIIIPAYNASAHIARTLDSVFAQSYRNFEVVLVNDGSPDTETLEVMLAAYRDRIRYLKQSNRGPSGARNAGVLAAKGKYVAFLDSDDAYSPRHLEQHVAMLQADPLLELVYSDSILMRGDEIVGHAFGNEPQHPPLTFEALLTEACTIATSSAMADRQAVINAGLFDQRFCRCEDFDLWLRMSFRGSRMAYRTDMTVYRYLTPGSLTSDSYLLKRARIEVYEKTRSTLPLTAAQRELIRSLIEITEVSCHKEKLRDSLARGEYAAALEEARRANDARTHWKLKLTVVGLRTMPQIFRHGQMLYERVLLKRRRAQRAKSVRKLQHSGASIATH